MRVAGSDQLGRRGYHQRIGSLDPAHSLIHCLLNGGRPQPLLHDDVGDNLAVRGGMEDGAALLQFISQLIGIGQIAVVRQGHPALVMVDNNGLGVALAVGAGGGVAHMTYNDVAGAQLLQPFLWKNIVYKSFITVGGKNAIIIDHDACALLTTVLQGKKPVIGQRCHISALF